MRKKLLQLAWNLKEDHFSIIACLLITLAQACHTYFLVVYSSRLDSDILKYSQAVIFSIVLSLGLLVNVFKSGSVSEQERGKYIKYSRIFAGIEIFINLHYWAKEMVYEKLMNELSPEYYDFSAAVVLSLTLPWLLYTYAGTINIPKYFNKQEGIYDINILKQIKKGRYRIETKEIGANSN